MEIISGKALWTLVCGQSVLPSDEVVGEELQNAAKHLQEGMSIYNLWSYDSLDPWLALSPLNKSKKQFIEQLGILLNLSAEHAWQMFQLFLQFEFKGAASELNSATCSAREETQLLQQVFAFYCSDSLHLLSCRRHILAAPHTHPYQSLFKDFITNVLDLNQTLGEKLIKQLSEMSGSSVTLKAPTSPHLPVNGIANWIAHRLGAIRHQLGTLLVYYGSPERSCQPQLVLKLLQLMQNGGLCQRSIECCEGINIKLNSFKSQTEAVEALHSFLLTLLINADADVDSHPLCDSKTINSIDTVVQTLGSRPWHLPPLLAWGLLQGQRMGAGGGGGVVGTPSADSAKYNRIVERALKGNVLQYINMALELEVLKTDNLLHVLVSSISYSLVCTFASCFEGITLGTPQMQMPLTGIALKSLKYEPPSHFFWTEEGGGASILLPPLLHKFPYDCNQLLHLLSTLAAANADSCAKVVRLLSELESLCWPIGDKEAAAISITGPQSRLLEGNLSYHQSQCVALTSFHLIPGVTITQGTPGTFLSPTSLSSSPLVIWQISTNGWQILLAMFVSLKNQFECGNACDNWLQCGVVWCLRLMCVVLQTDVMHMNALLHLRQEADALFTSVSHLTHPNHSLVASLLAFLAQVATVNPQTVCDSLQNSSLLPSFHINSLVQDNLYGSMAIHYKAGHIRRFVCGTEAGSGEYEVLSNLCALLDTAVKSRVSNSVVRGGIVFIVQEVFPVFLQWRFNCMTNKADIVADVMTLLHHTLDHSYQDESLKKFVVCSLVSIGEGGSNTLRCVLESGASLEATLDQPTTWPHSTHAKTLTKTAQMALSLIHRLFWYYIDWLKEVGEAFDMLLGMNGKGGANATPIAPKHSSPHLVLTIARFVYHRLNPRLPYLALHTLTKLAKELEMPLVACLGSEAEGLRDCLLARLDASTEDLWVKVALLRLLQASTRHQPGILNLFLSPHKPLIDCIHLLMQNYKKHEMNSASESLFFALVELLSSLWQANCSAAIDAVAKMDNFWTDITHVICNCKPGEVSEKIVVAILQMLSVEYFNADTKVGKDLGIVMGKFIGEKEGHFGIWAKHIVLSDITNSQIKCSGSSDDQKWLLLSTFGDFCVVLLKRAKGLFGEENKLSLGECVLNGLLVSLENPEQNLIPVSILANLHLSVAHHSDKCLSTSNSYLTSLLQMLNLLCACVMQVIAQSQLMLLSATLTVMIRVQKEQQDKQDFMSGVLSCGIILLEQHCSLCEVEQTTDNFKCSSSSVLGVCCAVVQQCLLYLPHSCSQEALLQSHLLHALLKAVNTHAQLGKSESLYEMLQLLSILSRLPSSSALINANILSTSVALHINQNQPYYSSVLCELLWCLTCCVQRDGAGAIEGAAAIAAVHLSALTAALSAPHKHIALSTAAAALAATMAPHHRLWRVIHHDCFVQLCNAAAAAVHKTAKLLQLRETLEREVSATIQSSDRKGREGGKGLPTVDVINQLLKVLSTCLSCMRHLSPSLLEVLCSTSLKDAPFTSCPSQSLVQPSCRRLSNDIPMALPTLASLTDLMDLFVTARSKEGRCTSPQKGASENSTLKSPPNEIDMALLGHGCEQAMVLLLTHCALLLSSNAAILPREAREIRTFLADEMDSFFSHLHGRRGGSSPPPLTSPQTLNLDLPFFNLCQQVVTSLTQVKHIGG